MECSEGLLLSLEQCRWNAVSWVKNCLVEVACEPLNDYRVFEEGSACSFDRSLARGSSLGGSCLDCQRVSR